MNVEKYMRMHTQEPQGGSVMITLVGLKSKGENKYESRWARGVWLGNLERSSEAIIGTPEGIVKARTVRRHAEYRERWNIEELTAVRGTPWEPVPGRGDNEVHPEVHIPTPQGIGRQQVGEERTAQVRRPHLRKELFEEPQRPR